MRQLTELQIQESFSEVWTTIKAELRYLLYSHAVRFIQARFQEDKPSEVYKRDEQTTGKT